MRPKRRPKRETKILTFREHFGPSPEDPSREAKWTQKKRKREPNGSQMGSIFHDFLGILVDLTKEAKGIQKRAKGTQKKNKMEPKRQNSQPGQSPASHNVRDV